MIVSFLEASSRLISGDARMKSIEIGEPMNLKVHSGGTRFVMCVKSAGRCGSGRDSTRSATFRESYDDDGGGGEKVLGRG